MFSVGGGISAFAGAATGMFQAPELAHRRALQEQATRMGESKINSQELINKQQEQINGMYEDSLRKLEAENTKNEIYKYFNAFEAGNDIKYMQAAIKTMNKSKFIDVYQDVVRVDTPADEDLATPDKLTQLEQSGMAPEQIKALMESTRKQYLTATHTNGSKSLISIPELYGSTLYNFEIQKRDAEKYTAQAKIEKDLAQAMKDKATAGKSDEEANKLKIENATLQDKYDVLGRVIADPKISDVEKLAMITNHFNSGDTRTSVQKNYEQYTNLKNSGNAEGAQTFKEFAKVDPLTNMQKNTMYEADTTGKSEKQVLEEKGLTKEASTGMVISDKIKTLYDKIPVFSAKDKKPITDYLNNPSFPASKYFQLLSQPANADKLASVREVQRMLSSTASGKLLHQKAATALGDGLSTLGSEIKDFEKNVEALKDKDGTVKYNFFDGILGKFTKYFGLEGVNEETKKKLLSNEKYQQALTSVYRVLLKVQSGATVSDTEAASMVTVLGSIYTNVRIPLNGISAKYKANIKALNDIGSIDRPLYNLTYRPVEESMNKIVATLEKQLAALEGKK